MAENLEIRVGANLESATKAFAKLKDDIDKAMKGGATSLADFAKKYQTTTDQIAKGSARAGQSVQKTGRDFTGLSRVLQDLPFGFMAIQNNITQLVPSAGALGLVISGITAAITFAQVGLSSWTRGFGAAGVAAKDAAFSINAAAEAIGNSTGKFSEAFVSVASLRNEIQLAKEGFISKTAVVNKFNETIGETVGKVSSLEEAEKSLQKNAQAYIKMTLYKAAANAALVEASQKALDAAKVQANPEGALNFFEKLNLPFKNAPSYQGQVKKFAKPYIDDLEKQGNTLEGIAKDFEDKAAAISKAFKFDFFGDQFRDKKIKLKAPPKEKIQKDLSYLLDRIFKEMQLPDLKIAIVPEVRDDSKQIISQFLLGLRHEIESKGDNEKIDPSDLFRGELAFKDFMKDGGQVATIIEDLRKKMKENLKQLGDDFGQSFVFSIGEGLGNALSGGGFKDIFAPVFNILGSFIQEIGKQMIIASSAMVALKKILKNLFANPVAGIAVGVGLVALGAIIKNSVGKVKAFAEGGLAFGPTLGLVGEGRGTNRSNPEVIAPLDQLKGMLGGMGGNINITGEFVQRGGDLVAVIAHTTRSQRRKY
jgi:hypothetical protein